MCQKSTVVASRVVRGHFVKSIYTAGCYCHGPGIATFPVYTDSSWIAVAAHPRTETSALFHLLDDGDGQARNGVYHLFNK